jgi:HAD superfamily hydrolase (TIGR01509 family)
MTSGPRGVVFDLDGVLVRSEHLWEEGWLAYADRHGRPWTSQDTRACQGMSVPEWGRYLADRTSHDADDATAAVVASVVAAYRAGAVALAIGARELVADAAARGPVALATSAPREVIEVVMDGMGLGTSFTAAVSSAEVRAGKPDPAVYLEAMRQAGISTGLAVEDSSNGVRAAARAGLRVLAVPDAAYPLAPDAAALADSVHTSLGSVRERLVALLDQGVTEAHRS